MGGSVTIGTDGTIYAVTGNKVYAFLREFTGAGQELLAYVPPGRAAYRQSGGRICAIFRLAPGELSAVVGGTQDKFLYQYLLINQVS